MHCATPITLIALCLSVAPSAAAQPPRGALEGVVADQRGGRLPGVVVELKAPSGDGPAAATTTTDVEGTFRIAAVPAGDYIVELVLDGFTTVRQPVRIEAGVTVRTTATLSVGGLAETVQVSASALALDVSTATQTASFSTEVLTELPTASRNYTHVIVAEAGVSAPLPDRTGKGLNIATAPGAQSDDATQSLNPSVNGARPTNNALRINGIDATNMLNANGSLGATLGVPLEALEEVEVQTALPSAASGRNGAAPYRSSHAQAATGCPARRDTTSSTRRSTPTSSS